MSNLEYVISVTGAARIDEIAYLLHKMDKLEMSYDSGITPSGIYPMLQDFEIEFIVQEKKWPNFRATLALARAEWSPNSYMGTIRDKKTKRLLGLLSPVAEKRLATSAKRTAVKEEDVRHLPMTL